MITKNTSTHARWRRLLAAAVFCCLPAALTAAGLPDIRTVFVILMENHNWDTILGSPYCPYINDTLLPRASYCAQYYNPPALHPSLPNYIWLVAGTNFDITNDHGPATNHRSTTNHLAFLLDRAGISWRTYQENITGTYPPLTNEYPYAVRHNPFVYFDNIFTNASYITNHVRPFTELAADLTNGRLARFNFISPNVTNDMHDLVSGGVSTRIQGDNWLKRELPALLNSAAFTNNGAIFLTWDEGNGSTSDGPIGMILLSPLAKGGAYTNTLYHDHSSLLRTWQDIFGLRPYLGAAANATPLTDLFNFVSLTEVQVLPNNLLRFRVDGLVPGRTNRVQFSTNLVTWTMFATNVASGPSMLFTNTTIPPRRFYRVTQ